MDKEGARYGSREGRGGETGGNGEANLEELANARRLEVTAVIPPQYNPIRRRLRPPLVESRFHSSAFCPLPLDPYFDPLARFSARFHRSLSFLRLFAGAPRPITSSVPHSRRLRSLFLSRVPLSSPPRCPLIFHLLFLPSASSLPRARTGLIFSSLLSFSISYSAPWE